MYNKKLIYHNNLDDKREIYCLLDRLHPIKRVQFLEWSCSQASFAKKGGKPVVLPSTYDLMKLAIRDDSASRELTHEIYLNLWQLESQFRFDLDLALQKLVELVRM